MEDAVKDGSPIRLGIIGLSEGNGHPYSWSAIINGYDKAAMEGCGFPAIPAYLGKRLFPEDRVAGAWVTHVWTQDAEISSRIARACLIPNVSRDFEDMLGQIDALLLARDDAERHQSFARPFLQAGLPVYVDKPVALSMADLDALFSMAARPSQIFSCSALRFSEELRLTEEEARFLGPLKAVVGTTPKSWERYAIHVIDPLVCFLAPGKVSSFEAHADRKSVSLSVVWEDQRSALIQATGRPTGDISLTYQGEREAVTKVFTDSFTAFRSALAAFLDGVRLGRSETPYDKLKDIVQLLEMGKRCVNS